ncbi:MAG: hypothetical protein M1561_01195 [Gammaproteobacteria bacterium]|nr:hypothetical protein [Gammaproteobacteria bacterium]
MDNKRILLEQFEPVASTFRIFNTFSKTNQNDIEQDWPINPDSCVIGAISTLRFCHNKSS